MNTNRENSTPSIVVSGLFQQYGKNKVIEDLDCSIPQARVVGLLGPNGAGKTTLLKTVATLLTPKAGHLDVLGYDLRRKEDVKQLRRHLGYLPQNFTVDTTFTVQQYVEYSLWMREVPKKDIVRLATQAIENVGLVEVSDRKISKLSGGMRQRAGIAAATANAPQLILLDEPTVGLDPAQRAEFRNSLGNFPLSTIILSTHLIEDISAAADYLLVMNKGKITYSGSSKILNQGSDRSLEALEARYLQLLAPADH